MTARQAAGLEPMQPAIRLHGCHRVGNQIAGIDPASPANGVAFWGGSRPEARWGISIDINGHVVGLVKLDGGATESAAFDVVADKFRVSRPGEADDPMDHGSVGVVDS